MLSACAGTPYVDSRREAGQKEPVGPSTLDMVAICHAGGDDTAVKALADSECAKTERVPERVLEQRWGCTLMAPRRIFFRCVAKP
jgi:hypothetical protein